MHQKDKIWLPESRKQANPGSEVPQTVYFEQIAAWNPLSGGVV